ncbi:unnamed protein product [Heligmosomoides polygyrus]|uniref:Uncharacterized protein n=1 Tax=Heligmosomoides polygyrus TaxID=6339 RepID=A0A3P8CYD9_HELPZ|nr:unnamed protein product [Heligmosomoides polygyrus]
MKHPNDRVRVVHPDDVVREGIVFEYANYFEVCFVLSNTQGKIKYRARIILPAGVFDRSELLHCDMIIEGLPPSVFFGSGFGHKCVSILFFSFTLTGGYHASTRGALLYFQDSRSLQITPLGEVWAIFFRPFLDLWSLESTIVTDGIVNSSTYQELGAYIGGSMLDSSDL